VGLRAVCFEDVDWIHLAHDMETGGNVSENGDEPSCAITISDLFIS
jgi:hypothetical protein